MRMVVIHKFWKHLTYIYKNVACVGPTISFAGVEGAKRIGDHFYFQSDQQQAKFYIMIVSTLEEEYFNISRIDMKLKEGEIIVQKIFRNSLNYTTMYTLILLKLTPLITMVYKLEAGLRVPSIGYKPHNSLVTVKITKLSGIVRGVLTRCFMEYF